MAEEISLEILIEADKADLTLGQRIFPLQMGK